MLKKKEKNKQKICSVCGKPYEFSLTVKYIDGQAYCEHDNPNAGLSKLEKRRRQNRLASLEAQQLAAKYAAQLPPEETVRVEPKYFTDGKKRKPLDVPKKIVEEIKQDIEKKGVDNVLNEIS